MNPIPEILKHNYWVHNSNRLKYSADVLLEKLRSIKDIDASTEILTENIRSLLEANFLLLGYSLENLLKGYSIFKFTRSQDVPPDSDYKFLSDQIWKVKNGHDIISIAKNAGLILNSDELNTFKKLERHIVWKGRYHIPKKIAEIITTTKPGRSEEYLVKDRNIVEQFISRLKEEISK